MKPYSNIMHSSVATPYAIGVSRAQTLFDQKRNLIPIKPGHEISIKVIPKIVTTTLEFDQEDVDIRKCKGSHETEGFYFLRQGDNSKRSAMRTKSYCLFGCSTCPLVFGGCQLSHLIFLKLRMKELLAKLSKFTK
jgi:hypothetical protein